ncbi:hypothetical protein FP2506_03930 [Fulvimarina pelagi HTCC2506]|uniref:UspA domain-containing protein n=2 Tax=Fulvimarina pelagi TaxID=217511 RepID=Q0FZD2_9HYPH|nr:universal stress protein [Fulvimarina pelagi]EAU40346.1 hypothetical protein FP2506_03930 [Fulvimarina pelagi HTCC2506]BAT31383.1 hypothetical protein [Fulvimarina pelagi]
MGDMLEPLAASGDTPTIGTADESRTESRLADVAVIADGSEHDETSLAYGERIANSFGAHLAVLYTNYVQLGALPLGPGSTFLLSQLRENGKAAGDKVEAALRSRLDALSGTWELRRAEGEIGDLLAAAITMAGVSDAVIASGRSALSAPGREIMEALLFKGSAPVLVVPDETAVLSKVNGFAKSVVIGWRDTPECARAIAASIPFLKRASTATLVNVAESNADEERRLVPMADMARHLSRHGIAVEVRHLAVWHNPAEALLNEAKMIGADMLVLGAYGHSRVYETVFGGVTREFLRSTPLPVLFSR